MDQYPKLIFNLVDQYLLLLVEILIHQIENKFGILIHGLELAILPKAPFFLQARREGSDYFFFQWCQILSRTICVDSLTLLFLIPKIHSKQNFHQRPDHCDRIPCMYDRNITANQIQESLSENNPFWSSTLRNISLIFRIKLKTKVNIVIVNWRIFSLLGAVWYYLYLQQTGHFL